MSLFSIPNTTGIMTNDSSMHRPDSDPTAAPNGRGLAALRVTLQPFNTDYVVVFLIATAAAVKTPRSIYCYSADSFPITAPNLTDLFPIVRPFMRAALITREHCFVFLN